MSFVIFLTIMIYYILGGKYLYVPIVISLFSLVISSVGYLSPIFFTPKIKLSVDPDPKSNMVKGNIKGVNYTWVRIKIENKEEILTTQAKGVYVKMLSVIKVDKDGEIEIDAVNTFHLRWVSSGHRNDGKEIYESSLGSGEHDYLNICTGYDISGVSTGGPHKKILVPGVPFVNTIGQGLTAGTDLTPFYVPTKLIFRVGIYGQNVHADEQSFMVTWNDESKDPSISVRATA